MPLTPLLRRLLEVRQFSSLEISTTPLLSCFELLGIIQRGQEISVLSKLGGYLAESELQIHVMFKIPPIFQKTLDSIDSNLVERVRLGCESKVNELCFALSFWFFLIAVCTVSALCPLKESV